MLHCVLIYHHKGVLFHVMLPTTPNWLEICSSEINHVVSTYN